MALFQKKPIIGTNIPLYTTGLSNTLIFIGLGNPESKYDGTRHNIGFAAIDSLAASLDASWVQKSDLKSLVATAMAGDNRIIMAKPTTFMNNSGEAAQALVHFYKAQSENLFVIHDELDVEFGQIRSRYGGSAAGHNGIKSIIQHIGEEFGRIRVGIGPKTPEQIDSADFVLAKFNSQEQEHMAALIKEVTALLSEYAYGSKLTSETRNFII